jgi:hypothetical protein
VTAEKVTDAGKSLSRRFYAEALSAAEQADLPEALEVDGMDEEIAVLRLKLRKALEQRPQDVPLIFRGIDLLARVVATRYRLSKPAERDLAGSIANVVRAVGVLLPPEYHHD